jgi:hypothetical protein
VEGVFGEYALILPDVNKVREDLCNKVSMIPTYEWTDNRIISDKIKEMANMRYKTRGASEAEKAVADLGIDDLREYVRNLIKTDIRVGIAILKKQEAIKR